MVRGNALPAGIRWRTPVGILDIFGKTAAVRFDAGGCVGTMHPGTVARQRKLVHVLPEIRE